MRHMLLCGVATAALLFATMGVAAAQTAEGPTCPTERLAVAGTIVENGNVTVTVQTYGFCNLATALISSWAIATDEIRDASRQYGVPLPGRLKFIGEIGTSLPTEQRPNLIVKTPMPELVTTVTDKK